MGSRHIPALDGIRGLAILLVMLYHYGIVLPTNTAVDHIWRSVVGTGGSGVSLFFVLSGFLITGILLDSKGSRGYFSVFYARRALRIFPLYYAVLLVVTVIVPLLTTRRPGLAALNGDEPWYWLYLSNVAVARAGEWRHATLDVSWSLAVEEQFYLVWPAVVLLCSARALRLVCWFMVMVAPLFRLMMFWLDVPGLTSVLTPAHLDGLGFGALIALQVRQPQGAELMRRWLPPLALGVGVYVVVAYTLYPPLAEPALTALFGVFVAAGVVIPSGAALVRPLEWPWLRAVGAYSYAMYLFHQPVRQAVLRVYPPERFLQVDGSAIPGLLPFMLVAGGVTFVAGALSWWLFESRILAYKRYFTYTSVAPADMTAPAADPMGAAQRSVAGPGT